MKNLSVKLVAILSLILLFSSCKENVKSDKEVIEETVQTEVKSKNTDKLKVMLHSTSLPLYMSVILNNKEALNIDKKQYQKFVEINKNKSPEAVKIALDNMEMNTFYGNIQFDTSNEAHGLQIGHEMVHIQWQRDDFGILVKQVIWPSDVATAEPLYPKP